MPRLFHRSQWYYEISPTALAEKEFEALLTAHAEIIKPDFWVVPYSRTVYAPDGTSARADLAFIDKQYREWHVIEVEMNRHSLRQHVLPQVGTLKDAKYGSKDAAYLATKNAELDPAKLDEMIRVSQPSVLVIVNRFDADWDLELRRQDVHQMTLEIYRSDAGGHIFSVDGELPTLASNVISTLKVDRILSNMAVLSAPASLGVPSGGTIALLFRDQLTDWSRLDIADACYLTPKARMPLALGQEYLILKTTDEYLIIQEN